MTHSRDGEGQGGEGRGRRRGEGGSSAGWGRVGVGVGGFGGGVGGWWEVGGGTQSRLLTLSPLLSAPCSGAPPGRASPADRDAAAAAAASGFHPADTFDSWPLRPLRPTVSHALLCSSLVPLWHKAVPLLSQRRLRGLFCCATAVWLTRVIIIIITVLRLPVAFHHNRMKSLGLDVSLCVYWP